MTTERESPRCLSAEEMRVLKFAVRRQLSRWANRRNPSAASCTSFYAFAGDFSFSSTAAVW